MWAGLQAVTVLWAAEQPSGYENPFCRVVAPALEHVPRVDLWLFTGPCPPARLLRAATHVLDWSWVSGRPVEDLAEQTAGWAAEVLRSAGATGTHEPSGSGQAGSSGTQPGTQPAAGSSVSSSCSSATDAPPRMRMLTTSNAAKVMELGVADFLQQLNIVVKSPDALDSMLDWHPGNELRGTL